MCRIFSAAAYLGSEWVCPIYLLQSFYQFQTCSPSRGISALFPALLDELSLYSLLHLHANFGQGVAGSTRLSLYLFSLQQYEIFLMMGCSSATFFIFYKIEVIKLLMSERHLGKSSTGPYTQMEIATMKADLT